VRLMRVGLLGKARHADNQHPSAALVSQTMPEQVEVSSPQHKVARRGWEQSPNLF